MYFFERPEIIDCPQCPESSPEKSNHPFDTSRCIGSDRFSARFEGTRRPAALTEGRAEVYVASWHPP